MKKVESKPINIPVSIIGDIGKVLIALAIASLAGVFYVSAQLYLPELQRYLELKARQDCAQSYVLEYTDTKTRTVVTHPSEELYKKCLTEKGLTQ